MTNQAVQTGSPAIHGPGHPITEPLVQIFRPHWAALQTNRRTIRYNSISHPKMANRQSPEDGGYERGGRLYRFGDTCNLVTGHMR